MFVPFSLLAGHGSSFLTRIKLEMISHRLRQFFKSNPLMPVIMANLDADCGHFANTDILVNDTASGFESIQGFSLGLAPDVSAVLVLVILEGFIAQNGFRLS